MTQTKGTILIIDDEVDLTNLMALHLKAKGYETHTAYSGIKGLEVLQKISPDLIILDLNMPGMGGIEFYNQICDNQGKPRYPVFVFTGRVDMEKIFQDFEIDGFLTKPFDIKDLSAKIDAVMQKKIADAQMQQTKNQNVSRNLLIVDDDYDALIKISRAFLDKGYSVRCAQSVSEAVNAVEENLPNLTLIKLTFREMPGDQLHLKLQNVRRNTSIATLIFVPNGTSYNSHMFQALAFKSNVEAVMEYFSPKELLAKVEALFE
jgi:DNA-binding response OmpR family regulator